MSAADERPVVLQVHNRYRGAGGEDAVVAHEAALLRRHGLEVHTDVVSNDGPAWSAAAGVVAAPWNPSQALRVGRIARSLATRSPEVVAHVHNTWFRLSPSVLRSLHRSGLAVVMTLHNFRFTCANALLYRSGGECTICVDAASPIAGVRHRCCDGSVTRSLATAATIASTQWTHAFERYVDAFICLSEQSVDIAIRAGLPPERLVLRPHSVEDPGARRRPASESDTVLFVGRMVGEKGPGDLLDAWELAGLHPARGLTLEMVGDGPMRADLEARAVPGVRFTGWLPPEAVAARMLDARALVVPSRWYETGPLSAIEGLAAGLPVCGFTVSAAGGMAAATAPELRAETVTPRALAGALGHLADDGLVAAASARARAVYEERHDPGQAADHLIDIYRKALHHRRGVATDRRGSR